MLFPQEIISWLYDQLILTGLFDERRLRVHARAPWTLRTRLVLADFQALQSVARKEAIEIAARFEMLGANREEPE